MTLHSSEKEYCLRLAEDSVNPNLTYIGKAPVGTLPAEAKWKIFRLDETSGVIITYADGNNKFDNVWDDREAPVYS